MRDRYSLPLALLGVLVMVNGVSLLGVFLRYPMDLIRFGGSLGSISLTYVGIFLTIPFFRGNGKAKENL